MKYALAIALFAISVQAAELKLKSGEKEIVYKTEDLLKHPAMKHLSVKKDPAYKNSRRVYKAVPLSELFAKLEVPEESLLNFVCLDGFSGPIPASLALERSPKRSRAYIAV